MSEALVATPGSTADSSGMGKTPAAKDKQCPFCRAPFTSSSLGRHLDLYIKEKNPKPPDGIHDVNEIRKLRGSVTRRQARTSSTKREGSTPSSAKPTPMPEQQSPSAPVFFPDNSQVDGGQVKTSLNRANWQATAVINDLPPPSTEVHSAHNRRRNMLRKPPIKEEVVRKQKTLEEKDRGQAAELALQEVLNRVKAAK